MKKMHKAAIKKKHNKFQSLLKSAQGKVRNLVIGSHYGINEPFYFDMLTKQQISPTKEFTSILAKFRFRWSCILILYWELPDGTKETEVIDITINGDHSYKDVSKSITEYQKEILDEAKLNKDRLITGNAILVAPVLQEIPETYVDQMLAIMEEVKNHLNKNRG